MICIKQVKKREIFSFKQRIWKLFNKKKGYFFKQKTYHFEISLEDKRIGYMKIEIIDNVAILDELIIKSEYRGKKYGHYAMEFFETFAKEHKCHKMRLKTNTELNTSAYHLYKKHGFKVEAVLKKDYFNKDWVILSKFIGKSED